MGSWGGGGPEKPKPYLTLEAETVKAYPTCLRILARGLGRFPLSTRIPGEERRSRWSRTGRIGTSSGHRGKQFFARLKDEISGRMVFVRGDRKVMAHLMYGVLAILAAQFLGSGS